MALNSIVTFWNLTLVIFKTNQMFKIGATKRGRSMEAVIP